jgi:hypothetical protein
MRHFSPHDLAHIAQWVIIVAGGVSFVAGIIWMVWLFRAFRRDLRRSKEGLCMYCGYDLRQSKDRCPECGREILKLK